MAIPFGVYEGNLRSSSGPELSLCLLILDRLELQNIDLNEGYENI